MSTIPVELSLFFGGTGFLNGIFLSVYFFFKKGHIIANKYLSLLLLAISIKIGYAFVFPVAASFADVQFIYWKIAISAYLSIGPLVFFYTMNSICYNFRIKQNILLHFIPAAVILFFPLSIIDNPIRFGLSQTHFLIYLSVSSYRLFKDYQSRKTDLNKVYEKIVKWNRSLLVALFIIWLSVLTRYLIELAALYSFIIYIFIFLVIERNKLFNQTFKPIEKEPDLKNSLLEFMVDEKPYLDPELSLTLLSEKVQIQKNLLSKIINDELGLKFTDFINSYRVKEVVQKFSNSGSEKYTIASIAYDCGFNNLSTFNLAFKKVLHITPSQYQKSLIN